MKKTKHLVLGGAGFLGGSLTRRLIEQGERPKILTRSSSSISSIDDVIEDVDIVHADFMDDVAIRRATKDIDTVFHTISTTFPGMTIESSVYDVFSNLLPTIRLVETCIANGVRKIVYASSGGTVYGEPKINPIPEDHPLMPKSAYGQSKLTIENYLNFYARSTGLEINVLRISNPFGPGQSSWRAQGIIGVAMGCAYNERSLKIYDGGKAVRDYIYIDDVTEAMLLAAATSGSSIVNVSSGMGRSVMDIVSSIEEVTGRTIRKEFVPARPGDVAVNVLCNKRAYEIYGWHPKIEFMDGLFKTKEQIESKLN